MGMRSFVKVGGTKDESNLTELDATESVNNGFMNHADWMAHIFRYAAIMKYIQRHPVYDILDVGCGRMPLLTFLWRNRVDLASVDYTGIDLRASEKWLVDGDRRTLPTDPNIRLIKMNVVRDDPSVVGQHRLVVCTEVFEHVERDMQQELLNRLFAWTKPTGVLYFSTPNLGGSDSVADNHVGPEGVRERSYDEKCEMLTKAGFVISGAFGTFIMQRNIPQHFANTEEAAIMHDIMPSSLYRVFAAVPFPAQSNNAMIICRRP
jgi:2-polyprenyl-3-methyl-5-hydroxy-6-metoxy-1,4-benzoquinol methylase